MPQLPIGNISHSFTNLQHSKLSVKKERFKEIVSSYSSAPEELNSLQKLANDFPFSQIIHLLLANATKKEDKISFKKSLTLAAFYSTDRSILKSLIENNKVPSDMGTPKIKTKAKPKVAVPKSSPFTKGKIDSDALRAEVLENLNILIQTKKENAEWLEDQAPAKPVKKEATTAKKKKVPSKTKPKPRVKKQATIIDEFIEKEPSISKKRSPVKEKEDLAEDSSKLRDDLVSESLAKIFASQGKTQKAIEIYKKLIWKLPQKKALFAAQIEKLKKK